MEKHLLKVKIADSCPNKELVEEYYRDKVNHVGYGGDCGVDLIIPQDYNIPVGKVVMIKLGIECEFHPNNESHYGPFQLIPRSSISKTPLIMVNSVGIIDPQYRGEICAPVRCFVDVDHPSTHISNRYKIDLGSRLFQVVAFDGKPIRVELVKELSRTERGTKGFGSTS